MKHDLAALQATPAEAWKRRFAERRLAGHGADASGVWGFREWVLPELGAAEVVTLGEGRSPLLHAGRLGRALGVPDLWVKQCGVSHTGSFKDLGMTVLVSAVAARRRDVRAVVCASTGDTSAALAAYAAAAGVAAVVLLPRSKVTTAQLVQPLAHGALVLALDTDFDGCMRIVRELSDDASYYLANSLNALRLEGQKTVALEVCQQLGWEAPDWIALPGGNLGNTAAVGMGLALAEATGLVGRRTKLLVGQAGAAAPLAHAYAAHDGYASFKPVTAGDTAATAIRIGDPVSIRRAIRQLERCGGAVESATEDELAEAAALADACGQYVCPQTAAALVAVQKAARRGEVRAGERVVVLSTAHGLKFSEAKVAYHERSLAGASTYARANAPVPLAPALGAVRDAIERRLDPRA